MIVIVRIFNYSSNSAAEKTSLPPGPPTICICCHQRIIIIHVLARSLAFFVICADIIIKEGIAFLTMPSLPIKALAKAKRQGQACH